MTTQSDFLEADAAKALVPVATPGEQLPAVVPAPKASEATTNILALMSVAIEKGQSSDSIAQLVTIYRECVAADAKSAFDRAKKAFQSECPTIGKNREYSMDKEDDHKPNRKPSKPIRFADLEKITRTVQPILKRHGFTYAWTQKLVSGNVTVDCILTHEQGHSETYSFTADASTNAKMSATQKGASATTFGQRYSLRLALGIQVGEDDDAREPHENPPESADAPQPRTRSERASPPSGSPVSAVMLKDLCEHWKSTVGDGQFSKTHFPEWCVRRATEASVAVPDAWKWDKPESWSLELYTACKENLP